MLLEFTLLPSPDSDPPASGRKTLESEPLLRAPTSGTRPSAPPLDEHVGAALRSAPVAIVTLDVEGRVTLWNAAAEALFGWSAEEARDRPATDDLCALAKRAERGDVVRSVEATPVRKDGSRITVRVSVAPMRSALGAPLGAVATFTRVA
jgi:PAS domain S-box-containing protein